MNADRIQIFFFRLYLIQTKIRHTLSCLPAKYVGLLRGRLLCQEILLFHSSGSTTQSGKKARGLAALPAFRPYLHTVLSGLSYFVTSGVCHIYLCVSL
ncbi:hypothetical protein CDAR_525691 [Caerostris darwini]|uniref:Uncharacterized protein n=1 Tax=Caerostris darwini TaxID=1538125 RepID=A0AAV4PXX4_9ARAC|nr:hypothetical protein CDAR_525691 [Caerostris darwini]